MTTPSIATGVLGLTATALISAIAPAYAQVCEPLEVVGGEGTEVTKTVSPPGALFIDDNWNTDFAVTTSYAYFLVNFLPESGESYDIDVHLKYPDDSIDSAYSVSNGIFPEGDSETIRVESRRNSNPYQVNLRVGGLNAEGNTYTASINGCR
ncbi:MAG: hypothetical protein F6J95_017040 [Leptolyngbya sp. SIO1E4]|nr:hypothetical protein [Leptolyngbya sp. SIO1E4]